MIVSWRKIRIFSLKICWHKLLHVLCVSNSLTTLKCILCDMQLRMGSEFEKLRNNRVLAAVMSGLMVLKLN